MYGVHLWLPKAHVEAPTLGRMILAGVLLKMGRYGVVLFHWRVTPSSVWSIGVVWLVFSLVFRRSVGFRSHDVKVLIAYSSIAHMGVTLLALWQMSYTLVVGLVIVGVSHGFARRGLFGYVNHLYEGFKTRSLLRIGGTLKARSTLTRVLLLLVVAKRAIPPSLALFGEITILRKVVKLGSLVVLSVISYVFMVGLYNVYLYLNIIHGYRRRMLRVRETSETSSGVTLLVFALVPLSSLVLLY